MSRSVCSSYELADWFSIFSEACVTPRALKRENIVLKLTTTLDILTDVLRELVSHRITWSS